jgi:beta-phosphoglucomutase family hydrolase
VPSIDWSSFDGVLFDLDGVITPTAEVHEHAWAELFRDHDFTSADYLAYVDGKQRYDGVRSFLASRGVTLPEGDPTDPPGDETVCALGNRKNDVFNEVIARDGIEPYPGSVAVLELLRRLDVPAAIVSSSKNARTVLTAAGLGDRFEYVVDGVVAAAEHLAGKPAPDMFLRGAELLGVDPARTAVVEDAVSGVAAAAAGGFALVIGVDRGGHAEELRAHGAEVIVADLADTLPADPPVDHGGSPA